MVFLIELVIPFLIFTGRPLRIFAAFAILFLQILIALTGNYAFFNLLTVALCLLLLDDQILVKITPKPLREKFAEIDPPRWPRLQKGLAIVLAIFIGTLSFCQFVNRMELPAILEAALVPIERFYFVNSYGLFAVMTTSRLEIQIEGSNDEKNWQVYQFKYKPGDLSSAPYVVAPRQPRLDWQMWFAALSDWRSNPWFPSLMFQILKGSSDVLNLFAKIPFTNMPPRYVRAELYKYAFTDFAERNQTGNWWHREYVGRYFPSVSLRTTDKEVDGTEKGKRPKK
jgi:hypothetical protein